MQIKEHLQFLVMMIPTLLLVVAAAVTFALPSRAAVEFGAGSACGDSSTAGSAG